MKTLILLAANLGLLAPYSLGQGAVETNTILKAKAPYPAVWPKVLAEIQFLLGGARQDPFRTLGWRTYRNRESVPLWLARPES